MFSAAGEGNGERSQNAMDSQFGEDPKQLYIKNVTPSEPLSTGVEDP